MYDKLSQGKYVTETILSGNQNPLLLICLDIFLVHLMKQPTFVRISYVWLRKTKFQSEFHVLGPVRPVPSNTCSTPWGTCTHIHTSRRNGVIQIQSPSLPSIYRHVFISRWVNQGTIAIAHGPRGNCFEEPACLCGSPNSRSHGWESMATTILPSLPERSSDTPAEKAW